MPSRLTPARATVPAAVLALAASLLAPAPAHAALRDANLAAVARIGSLDGCTVSSPTPAAKQTSFTDNGKWATVSVASSGTVTDPGEAPDTTTARSSSVSRVRVTSSGGTLSRAETRATVRASVDPALGTGTSCDPYAASEATAVLGFSVGRPGWVDVDLDVDSTGLVQQFGTVEIITPQEGDDPEAELTSSDRPATMTVFLQPGSYYLTSSTDAFASEFAESATAELHAVADFTAAGSASSRAKGPGGRYLLLQAGRDCLRDRLEARLTRQRKALRAVDTVTLRAPGSRTATVRRPGRGAPVLLRSIPERRAVTVTAVVRLKSGAKLEVSRSYLTCR